MKKKITQVGTNIGEDQLVAIAERAIVDAKQNLDVPQEPGLGNSRYLIVQGLYSRLTFFSGFDDFASAMKSTEIEAKMSVRFHD